MPSLFDAFSSYMNKKGSYAIDNAEKKLYNLYEQVHIRG